VVQSEVQAWEVHLLMLNHMCWRLLLA